MAFEKVGIGFFFACEFTKRKNNVREFMRIERFFREFVIFFTFVICEWTNREKRHSSVVRESQKYGEFVKS